MAQVAKASRYKRRSNYIFILVCVALGGYLLYDGRLHQEFIKEHTRPDGTADITLEVNRTWGPLACALGVAYLVVSGLRWRSKQVAADEQGLVLANGARVGYDQVLKIDKRQFAQKGRFSVVYEGSGGSEQELTLSERDYDGLGLLLDELVKQTGAAPEGGEMTGGTKPTTDR